MMKDLPQIPAAMPEGRWDSVLDERLALLQSTQILTSLDHDILIKIATLMEEVLIPAGRVVVAEGDTADRLFVIVTGRAEVWIAQGDGRSLLATLERGELFGEMGLLSQSGKRQATVTAATDLRVLCLAGEQLNHLAVEHPHSLHSLEAIADFRMKVNLVKRYSPFRSLPLERLGQLVAKLDTVRIEAGGIIIREGEPGDTCYLLRRGQMEVLVKDNGGSPRNVATLYPGCILGEAALLTDQPRNATVRAIEPCELMAMRRADLIDTLKDEVQVRQQLLNLIQQRSRPQRIDGVVVNEQTTDDGDIFRILKHPQSGAYARLAEDAWFVWQRLDGNHTLKDLALEFLAEHKVLAPDKIASIVADLTASGFVQTRTMRPDIAAEVNARRWTARFMVAARNIMEWRIMLRGIDGFLHGIHRRGGWLTFTRPVQVLLAIISASGLAAFLLAGERVQPIIKDPVQSPYLLLFLIPATFVSILLHESAHGLTTKHYAREVRGAGIGWYWFGPVAFIDSSDMWMAGRWPRIAVSLAGPYTNILLAGIAGLGALLSPSLLMAAALWQFAMIQYLSLMTNLNPLLEYDGYYILSDFLDKPNLRRHCLEWIGQHLWDSIRKPATLITHWFEFTYGILAIIFVGFMAWLAVTSYRAVLEGMLAGVLPAMVAAALPWAIAVITVVAATTHLVGEIRRLV